MKDDITKLKKYTVEEAYHEYYNVVVKLNPFIISGEIYNDVIMVFLERLPSDCLLHIGDGNPIVSSNDAKILWTKLNVGHFCILMGKPFYAPTHQRQDEKELRNYLYHQHSANLKKFEQETQEKAGATQGAVEPGKPRPASRPQDGTGVTQDKPAGATANTPQAGTQRQGKEQILKEIFYDEHKGILFLDENRRVKFSGVDKVFLECFLNEKSCLHVDSVIDRMSSARINTSWNRRYFDSTLSEINKKGCPLKVGKLIQNTGERCGEYRFSIKVKFKNFKSKIVVR